jgi:Methyltransferase FkbM domain
MHALLRSGLKFASRAVPPVHRLYRQRNQAFVERDRAVRELEHERRNARISGERCFHRGTTEDQARALRLFRLFSPVTLTSAPMIRVGRVGDGGYVMADDFSNIQAAFSFGIDKETSWDSDIAQRGIKVFQYDHSVDGPPVPNSRFVFHKKMIGEKQTKTSESIGSTLREHGASDTRNVLKMDIEGSEWIAFDAASPSELQRFSQIVCEFHDFEQIDDEIWYERALCAMTKLRSIFEIVHVHSNNHGHLGIFYNVPFPVVLEATFINKTGHSFALNTKTFPTPLDTPNEIGFADVFLGTFQF